MKSAILYLKLRSNVIMDGDVELARREASVLFDEILPISDPSQVTQAISLPQTQATSCVRKSPPIGFLAIAPRVDLPTLVRQLTFIQEVWGRSDLELLKAIGQFPWLYNIETSEGRFMCLIPMMASAELLTNLSKSCTPVHSVQDLTRLLAGSRPIAEASVPRDSTFRASSTPHVHSLHTYKAKFFPRLIRSFLVSNLSSLPHDSEDKILLLDPFVGSGTALVEAALLGVPSLGFDVDPLCCLISQAKVSALSFSCSGFDHILPEVSLANTKATFDSNGGMCPTYNFPPKIADKFKRSNTIEQQHAYEAEIDRWRQRIDLFADPTVRSLLQVCLSDALTRKFNVRMMGTGVGRFALEISNKQISAMMEANLVALHRSLQVLASLRAAYHLDTAPATIRNANATNMPLKDNSVSAIVTSPPYLPASSGRED